MRAANRLRLPLILAVGFGGLGLAGHSWAAFVKVNAKVPAECSVTGGALVFGSYINGQTTPKTGTATIGYQCAPGLSITINLDLGQQGDAAKQLRNLRNRAALGGGIKPTLLRYQLYRDPARAQPWLAGREAVSIEPTPAGPRTLTIYGEIAPGQAVTSGSYSDVVILDLAING